MVRIPLLVVLLTATSLRADAFDAYTPALLAKAIDDGLLQESPAITAEQIVDQDRRLPGAVGAFVVVRTGEGAFVKMLVQAAGRKGTNGQAVPMLLVDRFVTFRPTGAGVAASGTGVNLFPGFRFHGEYGQVVPEVIGGDLIVEPEAAGGRFVVKPLGKAKLYLAGKPLPEPAGAKRPAKLTVGTRFEPRFFNGRYRLRDDGRRSGVLEIKVDENKGTISGTYVSDRDGSEYEVTGKLGPARHALSFTIKLPQVEEQFTGWLFTGDGHAIAGTSKLVDREAGFYAIRIEE